MFKDADRRVTFDDVWFNAFEHLEGRRLVAPTVNEFGGRKAKNYPPSSSRKRKHGIERSADDQLRSLHRSPR
jgi:hypothetical protein